MVFLEEFKVGEKVVSGLTVGIDGPSEPEIKFDHEDNGNIEVTWTPYAPGFYDVHVKFNGTPVKDSPFNVKIVGEVGYFICILLTFVRPFTYNGIYKIKKLQNLSVYFKGVKHRI